MPRREGVPVLTAVPGQGRFPVGQPLAVTYRQDPDLPVVGSAEHLACQQAPVVPPWRLVRGVAEDFEARASHRRRSPDHRVRTDGSPDVALRELVGQAVALGADGVAGLTMTHEDRDGHRYVTLAGVTLHDLGAGPDRVLVTHLGPEELGRAVARGMWPRAAVVVRGWRSKHVTRPVGREVPDEDRDASTMLAAAIDDVRDELRWQVQRTGHPFALIGTLDHALAVGRCVRHSDPVTEAVNVVAEVTLVATLMEQRGDLPARPAGDVVGMVRLRDVR